jgi:hypothetical protein
LSRRVPFGGQAVSDPQAEHPDPHDGASFLDDLKKPLTTKATARTTITTTITFSITTAFYVPDLDRPGPGEQPQVEPSQVDVKTSSPDRSL